MSYNADDLHCHVSPNPYHRKKHSQATNTKVCSAKLEYDVKALLENPAFLQSQFPFTVHAKNVQESDVTMKVNNTFSNKSPDISTTFGCLQLELPEASGVQLFPSQTMADFPLQTKYTHFFQNQFPLALNGSQPTQSSETAMDILPSKPQEQWGPTFESSMNAHAILGRRNRLQSESTADRFVNSFPSSRRNADKRFGNEYSSSDQIQYMHKPMDLLNNGRSESFRNNDRSLSIKRELESIENYLSSNGIGNDQYFPNAIPFDIANQILVRSEGNNSQVGMSAFKNQQDDRISSSLPEYQYAEIGLSSSERGKDNYLPKTTTILDIAEKLLPLSEQNYEQVLKPDFEHYLLSNHISFKYYQLYSQTFPGNYDFAMNILAYIEILNDSTWKTTVTYFDENVKDMVKCHWVEKRNTINSNALRNHDRSVIFQTMKRFAELIPERKYRLFSFLQYCVIMCQLAVVARKCNFEEAPLYIIDILREGIREIENYLPDKVENCIKKMSKN